MLANTCTTVNLMVINAVSNSLVVHSITNKTYPGSHVTQSSGSLFPLVPLYFPTGQGSGVFAPCGQ